MTANKFIRQAKDLVAKLLSSLEGVLSIYADDDNSMGLIR